MATGATLTSPPSANPITEQFDSLACVSSRDRGRAVAPEPAAHGRYLRVEGREEALLIPLRSDALHIGRGIAVDLQLDDSSVSHRHAILISHAGGARLLDDRSLNGTFVNGRRIEQADLHDGDVIVVGRFELRYLDL